MSHVIGHGHHVTAVNRAAQQAAHMHHRQSAQIVQQNLLRQMLNRQLLSQVVYNVIASAPTQEDVQRLSEIVQEAERDELDAQQVEASVRDATQLGWLLSLLPKNRAERIAYLALLIEVVAFVVGQVRHQPTITPEQVEQIIERVVDHLDNQPSPEPPSESSPAPAPTPSLPPPQSSAPSSPLPHEHPEHLPDVR